ncbi:hypothetical protein AAG570_004416 [Ranatra chinensis]|uniref:Ig-like domain-containing protein n=1 Tax=Ranatra chinensis TaxID=642074 RepID=A0ABD0YFI3_9HEMI
MACKVAWENYNSVPASGVFVFQGLPYLTPNLPEESLVRLYGVWSILTVEGSDLRCSFHLSCGVALLPAGLRNSSAGIILVPSDFRPQSVMFDVRMEGSKETDNHVSISINGKKHRAVAEEIHGHLKLSPNELPQPQAPLFVERFEEQKVREKGTIRLVAKVVGNPIPSVTWFRNNKTLLASPRITEMFDGEQIVLEIVDADSEEDAGDYKCVASNTVGSATHGAKVTVDVEKVSFTKLLPPRVEVDETETTVLECETSHTVSTTWYHEGKELSGMDNREIIQEGRRQRLVIKRATPRDSGQYTCSVKDQKTSTTLKVHDVKPFFVRKLEDFEVKEQECAVLEVELSSDTAQVVWQKDGMDIEPKEGKVVMEKSGNVRKLFIRSTSVHDEGEYTCQLGDQECSAEVTVIELPPEILTKMQDTTVTRGEKASLEVELTKGDALVRWFKDDVELQFSEHVQLSIDGKRQKLKIYQAEDSDAGVYTCRVGDQVSSASLTVEELNVSSDWLRSIRPFIVAGSADPRRGDWTLDRPRAIKRSINNPDEE